MSRELSMTANAIRKREHRARMAALAQQIQPEVTPDGAAAPASGEAGEAAAPEGLSVTVAVPAAPQKPLSLKERLFGKKQVAAQPPIKKAPASRAKGKKEINLISSTLPTIVAGLIATYIQELLPAQYRPCAPSKNEVSAVLGPLFEIIGRRVEVVSKASEDAIDLANSFLAALAYGARAYVMYVQIKHAQKEDRHEQQATPGGARQQPARIDDYRPAAAPAPAASGGAAGSLSGGPVVGAGYPDPAENDAGIGGAADPDGDLTDRDIEAAAVSRLFKRDIAGRQRLGLLPAAIQ